jgi:hypothetical protein
MGLTVNFLRDLVALKRAGILDGARSVMEIGAQQLADSFLEAEAELDEIYRLFARPRIDLGAPVGPENFIEGAPYSRAFWTSLGFDYAAIDVDTRAGVTYLDLNRDDVPPDLYRAFDLVINAGTTEHVSNQGNAFRVIHDLARTGGVMYHELPAGGTIDHGFIAYQPKFFLRMAQQNEYEWLRFNLFAGKPVPIPADLHELHRRYGGSGDLKDHAIVEMSLCVAFRKRYRYPFSSPVDAAAHFVPRGRLPLSRRLWLLASQVPIFRRLYRIAVPRRESAAERVRAAATEPERDRR